MAARSQGRSAKSLPVSFDNQVVAEQIADLVIEGCVIAEMKAVQNLSRAHQAQILDYLKDTNFQLDLLINFGDGVEFKRLIHYLAKISER